VLFVSIYSIIIVGSPAVWAPNYSNQGSICNMPKGKVKWFNDQKGYGFVTPEDGSKDLFVHYQEIQGDGFKTLAEGQEVEFEVVESEKGPKAVKVVKL